MCVTEDKREVFICVFCVIFFWRNWKKLTFLSVLNFSQRFKKKKKVNVIPEFGISAQRSFSYRQTVLRLWTEGSGFGKLCGSVGSERKICPKM